MTDVVPDLAPSPPTGGFRALGGRSAGAVRHGGLVVVATAAGIALRVPVTAL